MKKYIILAIFLVGGLPTFALALGPQFGVDYVMLTTDIDGHTAKPSALQLRIENGILPGVSIEGVLATGAGDDDFNNCFPPGCTIKLTNMLGFFAKAGAPIAPGSEIYGRLGFATLKYEDETGASEDDSGLAYGIGAAFGIAPTMSMVLEYNWWPDMDLGGGFTLETTALSLGLKIGF